MEMIGVSPNFEGIMGMKNNEKSTFACQANRKLPSVFNGVIIGAYVFNSKAIMHTVYTCT